MNKFSILFLVLLFSACTQPTPDELHIQSLETRLAALTLEEKTLEDTLKATKDPGAIIELQSKIILHRSRIERVKATIEVLSPK